MNTTKIDTNTVPILCPQLINMFRVDWIHSDKEIMDTVSSQIVSFTVDYYNSTVKLTLEQPVIAGAMQEFLWEACKSKSKTYTFRVFPNVNIPNGYIIDYYVRITGHKFNLNYAESGVAMHEIDLKIDNIALIDPEKYNTENNQ